jgi:hypothetical protein
MNALKIALKITLPLGIAVFVAGLMIGFTDVPLIGTRNLSCGSGFGGGSGVLTENGEAECAPILAERDSWGTALVFVGFGLLVSAVVIAYPHRSQLFTFAIRTPLPPPAYGRPPQPGPMQQPPWPQPRPGRMQPPPQPGTWLYRPPTDGSR